MDESPHLRKMSSMARRMLRGAPGLETKSKTDLPSSLLISRSDLLDCCTSKRNCGVAMLLQQFGLSPFLVSGVACFARFVDSRSSLNTTVSTSK